MPATVSDNSKLKRRPGRERGQEGAVWTSQAAMAADLDVSPKQVSAWKRKEGFPSGPPFKVGEVVRWLASWNSPSRILTQKEDTDLLQVERQAKVAKAQAHADIMEMKAKQLRGALVEREFVVINAKQEFAVLKTRLEAIPDLCELELPREFLHIGGLVRRQINTALTELADWRNHPIPYPTDEEIAADDERFGK